MSELFTKLHQEDGGSTLVVQNTQDCTPIVEHTNALRQIGAVGSNEMKHAATFPSVIVESYLHTTGITFEEFIRDPSHVKKMLQDPALKYFRVWEGNV